MDEEDEEETSIEDDTDVVSDELCELVLGNGNVELVKLVFVDEMLCGL